MKNETYTYEQAVQMMNKRNERKPQAKKTSLYAWAVEHEAAITWAACLAFSAFWFSLVLF